MNIDKAQRYKLISMIPTSFKFRNEIYSLKQLEQVSPFPESTSIDSTKRHPLQYQVDLDIIVPAYNVKNYIEQCISSLLNQNTDYKYRIIIINDGSTDGTAELLSAYAKKNPNLIKLVSQNNKGLSGARNTGLRISNSKYITFVDSDDYVSSDFVNSLLIKCFETAADIVEGSYETVDLSGSTIKQYEVPTTGENVFSLLYGFPWGKAYKSSLLNNIIFPERLWFEDTMPIYRIWPKARRVFNINKHIYKYRINPQGITHSAQKNVKSLDSLYITIQLLKDCKKENEKLDINVYNFSLSQMIMNFYRIDMLNDHVLKCSFSIMCDLINRYFPEEKFRTERSDLKNIEKALRLKNYSLFVNNAIVFFF